MSITKLPPSPLFTLLLSSLHDCPRVADLASQLFSHEGENNLRDFNMVRTNWKLVDFRQKPRHWKKIHKNTHFKTEIAYKCKYLEGETCAWEVNKDLLKVSFLGKLNFSLNFLYFSANKGKLVVREYCQDFSTLVNVFFFLLKNYI